MVALACGNSTRVRPKIITLGLRADPWSRPLMFGFAESEHPRLTNGEIILEEVQPMWSQSSLPTWQTDWRTDKRHAIKVHRAVKKLT